MIERFTLKVHTSEELDKLVTQLNKFEEYRLGAIFNPLDAFRDDSRQDPRLPKALETIFRPLAHELILNTTHSARETNPELDPHANVSSQTLPTLQNSYPDTPAIEFTISHKDGRYGLFAITSPIPSQDRSLPPKPRPTLKELIIARNPDDSTLSGLQTFLPHGVFHERLNRSGIGSRLFQTDHPGTNHDLRTQGLLFWT